MKTLFICEILILIYIVGYVATKAGKDIKIADTVKMAEEIKVAETMPVEASAKVVAGVDKSQTQETTQTAGRDLQITTDPELIKTIYQTEKKLMTYIIKGLLGIIATLIGIISYTIKSLLKTTKQKKFYKDVCLTKTTKDEHDLGMLRQMHDKYIKTGRLE